MTPRRPRTAVVEINVCVGHSALTFSVWRRCCNPGYPKSKVSRGAKFGRRKWRTVNVRFSGFHSFIVCDKHFWFGWQFVVVASDDDINGDTLTTSNSRPRAITLKWHIKYDMQRPRLVWDEIAFSNYFNVFFLGKTWHYESVWSGSGSGSRSGGSMVRDDEKAIPVI